MAKAKAKAKTKTAKSVPDIEHAGFQLFAAIGRFSVRFRWLVVLFWLVAVVLIVHYLPSLGSVTQSDNTAFLPSSSPTEKAINMENAFRQSSKVLTVPVVIASNNGPLNQADIQAVGQLSQSFSSLPQVKQVADRGRSADGMAELLEVQSLSQRSGQSFDTSPIIQSLRDTISKANLPNGLEAHLSGQLADATDSAKGSDKQNGQVQLGTVIFIIILLLFIFKAPLAPLITLVPPLLVVTASGPLIAEAAHHGLKVSALAQLLLTVLVLGAGTDYGLFLIFRVREELEGGLSSQEAIVKALSRVGESITFSALTVVAALLSLLVATFQIYSNLGVPLAIGIGLMLLAGLTLLPALLAIFGRAVFWPRRPQNRKQKEIGLWGRISSRIVQRPVPVLIAGVVFFGILASASINYQAGGFGGQTTPPSGSDSSKGDALLAKHFPSNSSNPTEILFAFNSPIWQNPDPVLKAQHLLQASPEFNHVTGMLNPNGIALTQAQFKQLYTKFGSPWDLSPSKLKPGPLTPNVLLLYKATSAFVSPDGKTIQFAVGLSAGNASSTVAMESVPSVRAKVEEIQNKIGASASGVVGEAPAFYDISSISNADLLRVVPVAILVIGVLLGILMRSLIAPLYLVASVVLSYLAALGASVLIFLDIRHEGGIIFILPFLMFIFLLALGEDYNILVMTRIREEAHGKPLKKAVTEALNTTGTTVTSAGLVLAGTFTVLGVVGGGSGNGEVRDIGFGLAIGIIMDTFLVRTLLVPSIVVILGKWNWWPTRHGSWVSEEKD